MEMNEVEINARFAALVAQRDEANNKVVILEGIAATLKTKVAEYENAKDVEVPQIEDEKD